MSIKREIVKYFLKHSLGINSSIVSKQNKFAELFNMGKIPLPKIIHLETRARCNSACSFCLANIKDDPREDLLMSNELILKIIKELNQIDYSNRISFYSNNEPFLDKRIIEIIKNTRKQVPKAYLEIKSNGIGLKIEKIIESFNAGLDTLYINDYTDNSEHSPNIQRLKNTLKSIRRFKGHYKSRAAKYNNRIIIYKRRINEQLDTRAGTSPNANSIKSPLNLPCFTSCEKMVISPEGYVTVCSEDFFYSIRMGDVNKQNIIDIWNSEKFNTFRTELIKGNRNFHNACSKCDYKGYTYETFQ